MEMAIFSVGGMGLENAEREGSKEGRVLRREVLGPERETAR